MKNCLIFIVLAFMQAFCLYTAKCPSWEIGTYSQFQCVSYGESNFYVAGSNSQWAPSGDQIQKPGKPAKDGVSIDTNVSYYGWWYCDSLDAVSRKNICESNFVYCADAGSGYLKNDTVLVIDTIFSTISLVDTLKDTLVLKTTVYDTVKTNIYDTLKIAVNVYDTTYITVYDTINTTMTKIDTVKTTVLDTVHKVLTKTDTIRNWDTLRIAVNIHDTTIMYDTLFKSLLDTMYLTIEIPKVLDISQSSLIETPVIRTGIDPTYYKLAENSLLIVQYHFSVFDNTGHFVAERKGLDTIYDHGKYIDHEHDLFEMTGLGMIADNGRLLGTGAYIVKGSYVVFLDSKSNYREFVTKRYGIKRR